MCACTFFLFNQDLLCLSQSACIHSECDKIYNTSAADVYSKWFMSSSWRHGDLQSCGDDAGIVDSLRVSRRGHFSCPVLAGVVFIANFDAREDATKQDVFAALQVSLITHT